MSGGWARRAATRPAAPEVSLQALRQALHLLLGRHILLQLLNRLRAVRVQEHRES